MTEKNTPEADGCEDAEDVIRDLERDELGQILAPGTVLPDESLINAMGFDWVAKRWGVDLESTAFEEACGRYNKAYLARIREEYEAGE